MPVLFRVDYHARILSDSCPPSIPQLTLLWEIIPANLETDLDQSRSELHFDNCAFELGSRRVSGLWTQIEAGEDVYKNFGALTHTVQDFYAHSNWVELHQGQDPIPVWDLDVGTLPAGIVSGTYPDHPQLCGPGAPTHEQLNKDDPGSVEGGKVVEDGPNTGKRLFDLAFDAATRATAEQFARLAATLGVGS
jgi:hypothetical protein